MTRRNFLLQKENYCKVRLRFVNCCTLVFTEGYHIIYFFLRRTDYSNAILLCPGCISKEPAGGIISGKGSAVSVNAAGESEPLSREFRH